MRTLSIVVFVSLVSGVGALPAVAAVPGAFSLSANAYCNTTPPVAPAVKLTWTASSGATSYTLYRNGSVYASGITGTTYDNNANVAAGATYTYYVRAINGSGGTDSNSVSVAVPSNTCQSAPGSFTVSANAYCNTGTPAVKVTWTSSSGATSYTLYRNGSVYAAGITGTSFDNTANVAAGASYTYFVRASNGSQTTDSNTASVAVPSNVCGTALGTASLSGSAYCNGGTPAVKLTWSAATGATSYTLYRNGSVYAAGITGTSYDNTANVAAGATYSYFVRATNGSQTTDSNTVSVPVSSTICGPTLGTPVLSGSAYCNAGSPAVKLTWSAAAGATSYTLVRNGSVYATGIIGTTFDNTANVSLGVSYTYAVRATDGSQTAESNTITVNVDAAVCGTLSAPSLTAAPYCNGTSPAVKLTWTAVTGATSYTVYRNGAVYASDVTGTSFDNTANVTTGVSYACFVRAVKGVQTADSNTVTTTGPSCAVLAAGTLSATAYCNNGSPAVKLTWTAVAGATSYTLFRNGAVYATGITGTTYDNTANVTAGTTYTYFVRATNGTATSDSNSASVTPGAGLCSSVTITLTATAYCNAGMPAVKLTWTAVPSATFVIIRNGATYATGITGTTFDNTANVTAGQTYTYTVRATVGGGTVDSNVVTVTPASDICVAASITLSASAYCNVTAPAVKLTWTSLSSALSYTVYRNGAIYASGVTGTSFDNTAAVVAGQSYTYFVRATTTGASVDSNSISVAVPATVCPAPQTITLSANAYCDTTPPASPAVSLSWSAVTGASSYTLYRNGAPYVSGIIGTTYANTANVVAGQTYAYFVRAATSAGNVDSNTVSVSVPAGICPATTPLPQPFSVAGTVFCRSTTPPAPAVRISWSASQNATSYAVSRGGASYATGLSGTSFDDVGVAPGQSYTYVVRALNVAGFVDSSAVTVLVGSDSCGQSPQSFTLSVKDGCNGVAPVMRLSWSASTGASSYVVYRNGARYSDALTALFYDDTGVTAGQSYTYVVRAQNGANTIDSNSASGTASVAGCATVPGGFTLTSTLACNGSKPFVALSWSASNAATSYTVYRNSSAYSNALPAQTTHFEDVSVSTGTTYSYSVRATNTAGSKDSNAQNILVSGDACIAAAPDLTVQSVFTSQASATAGQTVGVTASILNRGGAAAGATTARVRFGSGNAAAGADPILGEAVTAPLIAGAATSMSANVTIPASAAPGKYNIFVKADDGDAVVESDETNNVALAGIQVVPAVSCTIGCATSVPSSGTVNTPLTFSLKDPPSCPSATVTWTFGNETLSGPTVSRTFSAAASYPWKVTVAGGEKSCEQSGSVTISAGASSVVAGVVSDLATKSPLSGATVSIDGRAAQPAGGTGEYSISGIAAGPHSVIVSRAGYTTVTDQISVPASAARFERNFLLAAQRQLGTVTVNHVTSRYRAKSHFLDGVAMRVTFNAQIDWGGHPPGTLTVTTTPQRTVPVTGGSASIDIDVGREIGACHSLQFQARSSDGAASALLPVDVVVMPPPPGLTSYGWRVRDMPGDLSYVMDEFTFAEISRDHKTAGNNLPEHLPFFNKRAVELSFTPKIDIGVTDDGVATYGGFDASVGGVVSLRASKKHRGSVPVTVTNVDFALDPSFDLQVRFDDGTCKWSTFGGSFGVDANVSRNGTYRIPATYYLASVSYKVGFKAGPEWEFTSLSPLRWRTKNAVFTPYIELGAGIGWEILAELEVTGHGEARFDLYPDFDGTLAGYLEWRAVLAHGLWTREHKVLDCEYHITTHEFGCSPASIFAVEQAEGFYPRKYLAKAGYAQFVSGNVMSFSGSAAGTPSISPIQTTILPIAQPSVSSAGGTAHLVWIYDNPQRTTANRSMAVSSTWNGTRWSAPVPVSDDGTGDASPNVLAFANGSAIAAWVNQSTLLSDNTSSAAEILRASEIAVATYDVVAKKWTSRRLTNNNYFDAAPRLTGADPKNVMAVWMANESNEMAGSSSAPDELWSSRWNGTTWTAPERIATIPHHIVAFTTAYDGSNANVVFTVETQEQTGPSAHELFRVEYTKGKWGAVARLTQDAVVDDAPQVFLTPGGKFKTVWLRDGVLTQMTGFEAGDASAIVTLDNAATTVDLKLASGGNGLVAVVWASSSDTNVSDLYAVFYDPATDLWGVPVGLTSDPEIEKFVTATFDNTNHLIAVYARSANDSTGLDATTDLYMTTHEVKGDLAVDSKSIAVTPSNPRPGTPSSATVTVFNRGDTAADQPAVALYSGTTVLGTTRVAGTLRPGASSEVRFDWNAPQGAAPLSVVIDPQQQFADSDRSNNTAVLRAMRPDLAIDILSADLSSASSVVVMIRVANHGAAAASATTVVLRTYDGRPIGTVAIPALDPDASYEQSVRIIDATLGESQRLVATVITSDSDFDPLNDTRATVIPAASNRHRAVRH